MYTQENFTQLKQTVSCFLLSAPLKQFYKKAFNMGNVVAIFVYASIRLMLHDFPFEIMEEIFFIVRIFLAAWCLAALCVGGFMLLMFIADNKVKIHRIMTMKVIALYQVCIQAIKTNGNGRIVVPERPIIESTEMMMRF